jgi:K+-transporting ATPase ATPase C chain
MKNIQTSLRLGIFSMIVLSILYPLTLWIFASVVSPHSAAGSLVYGNDQSNPIGSELIAQGFSKPYYFHSRPSAVDFNASAAGASNFGPTNPKLTQRAQAIVEAYPLTMGQKIPADLVAASGSGLDPHISVEAAYFQASRVAGHRNISESALRRMIDTLARRSSFGLTDERIVNVLELNLELDKTLPGTSK